MKAIFGASLILLMSFTIPSLAYIDPVTSSIVIQAIVGGFAAFLVSVRRVRERINSFFRRKPADNENDDKK